MTNHRVKVGDADLAVRIDGTTDLPWLILSHSLASDMTIWDAQMPCFSERRRVLRYDARGHGASSAPVGPYALEDLTGDVVSLMDHFCIEKADIVGLSMGGMTALGTALSYPARVARVVCANAPAAFKRSAIDAWDERIEKVSQHGMDGVLDKTIDRWFVPGTLRRRPHVEQHARDMILNTSIEGYVGCVEALKQLAHLPRLRQLSRPVLYIAGSDDSAAPPAVMSEMACLTPGGKLVVLGDAAHISNVDAPQAFNKAVSNFLFQDASGRASGLASATM